LKSQVKAESARLRTTRFPKSINQKANSWTQSKVPVSLRKQLRNLATESAANLQRNMMRRTEIDLERGDGVEALKQSPQTSVHDVDHIVPKSPKSPKSTKSPKLPKSPKSPKDERAPRNPKRKDSRKNSEKDQHIHDHRDSYSFDGSSRERSLISFDKIDNVDEKNIIINCGCEDAQNRTFLPFGQPSDYGLTRPSKGTSPRVHT
jgi:hypothetical protein